MLVIMRLKCWQMLTSLTILLFVYYRDHFTSTYRNSIKVVSLQALLGSNDILGQIQTV